MELSERIRKCAEIAGSGYALSRKTGIPRNTLESYLTGKSEPKASRLAAIAKAVGVSLDWLVMGEEVRGGMPIEGAMVDLPSAVARAPQPLDEDLNALVVDGISRLYKEEHVGLPAAELGRLAARIYSDLVAAYDDSDERLVGLKGMLAGLRRQLRQPLTPSDGADAQPNAGFDSGLRSIPRQRA